MHTLLKTIYFVETEPGRDRKSKQTNDHRRIRIRKLPKKCHAHVALEKHVGNVLRKQLIPRSHRLTRPTEELAVALHSVAQASVARVCLIEPY